MAKKSFKALMKNKQNSAAVEGVNQVIENKSPEFDKRDGMAHQIMSDIARPEIEAEGQIVRVPITEVYAETQVRPDQDFDDEVIDGMADSFVTVGILTPPRCFPRDRNGYRIWMGETRWRSAKKRGDSHIDIYVGTPPKDDKMRIIGQLIENLQQSGLKPLATALAFDELKRLHNMSGEDIAKTVGKPTSYISKHLRLVDAPESVIKLLRDGVTSDIDLAYTLTQISELSPQVTDKLTSQARTSGLTRTDAKGELDRLKSKKNGKISHAKSTSKNKKKAANASPVWSVQVQFDGQVGTIVTDRAPDADHKVWVRTVEGDVSVDAASLIVQGVIKG
ncbi:MULTISPECIES: ParB/RepB/Spo0J family partition protein [Morganellaceae]|uniref:Chromosome partitioning protein ParB n=1 Tax=Morganella psychrotolerans TaxID=368603 RepID=A0A1B8HML3_9GAMM|nr:ParB/RepB/Spo0J family partition protein [Morganella psychrotolerans]OBU10542.1 chromosome partitioning protein ParB [Morganella psychrotolerans]